MIVIYPLSTSALYNFLSPCQTPRQMIPCGIVFIIFPISREETAVTEASGHSASHQVLSDSSRYSCTPGEFACQFNIAHWLICLQRVINGLRAIDSCLEGRPRQPRTLRIASGGWIAARILKRAPHRGHSKTSIETTLFTPDRIRGYRCYGCYRYRWAMDAMLTM